MKRFLSLALASIMVLTMIVLPVSAADVVYITMKNNTSYTTLAQAINAIPDGGEGVITGDTVKYYEDLTIPANKKITLKGGITFYGHIVVNGDLTIQKGYYLPPEGTKGEKIVTVNQGGKLTVKGSGTTFGKNADPASISTAIYNNGGEVTIDNGIFTTDVNYDYRYKIATLINASGTMTINNGKVTSDQFAIQVVGGEVIINGGYFGLTYFWGDQVIEVCGGKLTINGGYINHFYNRTMDTETGAIRRVGGEVKINGGYFPDDKFLHDYIADDAYIADSTEVYNGTTFKYQVVPAEKAENVSIEIEEIDAVTYTAKLDEKEATLRVISKVEFPEEYEVERIGTKLIPQDKLASGNWATVIGYDSEIESGETFSSDFVKIEEKYFDTDFVAVSFIKFKGYETVYSAQVIGSVKNNGSNIGTKRTLQCDEDGNFTILLVADPQFEMYNDYTDARNELENLVQKVNPDYVLINGDMENLGKMAQDEFRMFIEPLESRNIPWSTTNGNHDEYSIENDRIYRGYANNLNETLDTSKIPYYNPAYGKRKTNYALPIYANNGEDVVFVNYGMDSGNSTPLGYDTLETWQMEWYKEQSEFFTELNGGTPIPSILSIHIPVPEFVDLWCARKDAGTTDPNVHGPRGDLYEVFGNWDGIKLAGRTHTCRNGTVVSSSAMGTTVEGNNRGLFDLVKAQGDIKGIFFGHCHDVTYIGSLEGVLLGCIGKLGKGRESHTTRNHGGRVIEFNQDAPEDFVTYWIPALEEGTFEYGNLDTVPTEPQPKIYSDGTLAE